MVERPRQDPGEDAVSPVVGTILLVAIAVALAALTFVIAFVIIDEPQERFPATFIPDETNNRVILQSIEWSTPLYWNTTDGSDTLTVDGCTAVNGASIDGTVQVQAGDILACSPGLVTITHSDSGRLIFSTRFE